VLFSRKKRRKKETGNVSPLVEVSLQKIKMNYRKRQTLYTFSRKITSIFFILIKRRRKAATKAAAAFHKVKACVFKSGKTFFGLLIDRCYKRSIRTTKQPASELRRLM
jgi:hypothetical protein